jgi:hypothetical protein
LAQQFLHVLHGRRFYRRPNWRRDLNLVLSNIERCSVDPTGTRNHRAVLFEHANRAVSFVPTTRKPFNGARREKISGRLDLNRVSIRPPALMFTTLLRAPVRRHRSAPLPGRASERQGASPSWLMSASNAGCDQSGSGAPPLDRNGEPDPCLLGSPVGRDKGRNAF